MFECVRASYDVSGAEPTMGETLALCPWGILLDEFSDCESAAGVG